MRHRATSEIAGKFLDIQKLKKRLDERAIVLTHLNYQKIIGRKIENERKRLNLKQTELARVLGISNTHLSTIENGAIKNLDIIFKVSAVFERPPEWFFQQEGTEMPSDVYKMLTNMQNRIGEIEKKYGK